MPAADFIFQAIEDTDFVVKERFFLNPSMLASIADFLAPYAWIEQSIAADDLAVTVDPVKQGFKVTLYGIYDDEKDGSADPENPESVSFIIPMPTKIMPMKDATRQDLTTESQLTYQVELATEYGPAVDQNFAKELADKGITWEDLGKDVYRYSGSEDDLADLINGAFDPADIALIEVAPTRANTQQDLTVEAQVLVKTLLGEGDGDPNYDLEDPTKAEREQDRYDRALKQVPQANTHTYDVHRVRQSIARRVSTTAPNEHQAQINVLAKYAKLKGIKPALAIHLWRKGDITLKRV